MLWTALALGFVPAGCARVDQANAVTPAAFDLLERPAAQSGRRSGPLAQSPIRHVVIVVQENRSFDNLFAGYPGADTQAYGYGLLGNKIPLRPVSLAAKYGLDHFSPQFFADYDNGRMDGFQSEPAGGPHPANPAYGYVPHAETKIYFQMAHQYVLADRMFTSHIDASFVSHQYIIAGQAQHSVDVPTIQWGCGGNNEDTVDTLNFDRSYGLQQSPCFNYTTLGDELDQAGLTWRFYAAGLTDIWSGYQAVSHIYNGKDWANVIAPNTQFLTDVGKGILSNVTWITPNCTTSDHAGCGTKLGPEWVASIVDAVGESPFWNSTAIFVMWDEWGGGTITYRRRTSTTTASASGYRCSSSRRTPSTATCRTCNTSTGACCASPRISSAWRAWPRATSGQTRPRTTPSISPPPPSRSCRSGRISRRRTTTGSFPTAACPTTTAELPGPRTRRVPAPTRTFGPFGARRSWRGRRKG